MRAIHHETTVLDFLDLLPDLVGRFCRLYFCYYYYKYLWQIASQDWRDLGLSRRSLYKAHLIHVVAQFFDDAFVALERFTNCFLEVVNAGKLREEWEYIFYLEEFTGLQELHGVSDVLFFAHDVLR